MPPACRVGTVWTGKEDVAAASVEENGESLRRCADVDGALPEFTIVLVLQRHARRTLLVSQLTFSVGTVAVIARDQVVEDS